MVKTHRLYKNDIETTYEGTHELSKSCSSSCTVLLEKKCTRLAEKLRFILIQNNAINDCLKAEQSVRHNNISYERLFVENILEGNLHSIYLALSGSDMKDNLIRLFGLELCSQTPT